MAKRFLHAFLVAQRLPALAAALVPMLAGTVGAGVTIGTVGTVGTLSVPVSAHAQAAKRPDATRARFLTATRLARAALYPRYDDASMQTGESFSSPSLGLAASDMVLRDFNLGAVGAAGERPIAPQSRFVAAALLKPVGFPPSYTLLEVAVLQGDESGELHLQRNLKVRVDAGNGSGEVSMELGSVASDAAGTLRFEVLVREDGRVLRHRFRHDGKRLALIRSMLAN